MSKYFEPNRQFDQRRTFQKNDNHIIVNFVQNYLDF